MKEKIKAFFWAICIFAAFFAGCSVNEEIEESGGIAKVSFCAKDSNARTALPNVGNLADYAYTVKGKLSGGAEVTLLSNVEYSKLAEGVKIQTGEWSFAIEAYKQGAKVLCGSSSATINSGNNTVNFSLDIAQGSGAVNIKISFPNTVKTVKALLVESIENVNAQNAEVLEIANSEATFAKEKVSSGNHYVVFFLYDAQGNLAISPVYEAVRVANGLESVANISVSQVNVFAAKVTLYTGDGVASVAHEVILKSGEKEIQMTADTGNSNYLAHCAAGEYEVIVKDGGKIVTTDKTSITVNAGETVTNNTINVVGISLQQTLSLAKGGDATTLTAQVYPENYGTVKWQISNNDAATIPANSTGLSVQVTPKDDIAQTKTATITAALYKAETKVAEAQCELTVVMTQKPLQSITLAPANFSLAFDHGATVMPSQNVTYTLVPSDATTVSEIEWTSSATDVATVQGTAGGAVIAAKKAGNATITMKAKGAGANNADISATCSVTITENAIVQSISISPQSITLKKNDNESENSKKLTATVTMSDNSTNYTGNIEWKSSSAGIATVDQTGKVVAAGSGTATITATAGGKSATCQVTVKIPVTSLSLNKNALTLEEPSAAQNKINPVSETLNVTVNPSNATDATVTWKTNNAQVATVVGGVVTAVGKGTAIITATADGKSATCQVTVKKPVTAVSLSKTSLELEWGNGAAENKKTATLTKTVTPADASDATIIWESSNTNVATVDQNGKVTTNGAGSAKITAKSNYNNQIKAECQVNVTGVGTGSFNGVNISTKLDEHFSSLTISGGKVTANMSDSATYTFEWYIDGAKQSGASGKTFTLPADLALGKTYQIMATATANGMTYSGVGTFTYAVKSFELKTIDGSSNWVDKNYYYYNGNDVIGGVSKNFKLVPKDTAERTMSSVRADTGVSNGSVVIEVGAPNASTHKSTVTVTYMGVSATYEIVAFNQTENGWYNDGDKYVAMLKKESYWALKEVGGVVAIDAALAQVSGEQTRDFNAADIWWQNPICKGSNTQFNGATITLKMRANAPNANNFDAVLTFANSTIKAWRFFTICERGGGHWNSGGSADFPDNITIANDTWTRITYVFESSDTSKFKIYKDGALQATVSLAGSNGGTSELVKYMDKIGVGIGHNAAAANGGDGNGLWLAGYVDEGTYFSDLVIYNRALSATEVSALN